MITGFNTDIEHDGVTYHVQTEDKGLDSPIILSLVYTGGTILASKRSPYEDLIAEGFSDEALAERLKRQHRLICAAIHSGRINDLKKMTVRPKFAPAGKEGAAPVVTDEEMPVVAEEETTAVMEAEAPEVAEEEAPVVEEAAAPAPVEDFEIEYWPMTQQWVPPPPPEPAPPAEEMAFEAEEMQQRYEPVETPVSSAEVVEPELEEFLAEPDLEDGLVITLLDDDEFYSGQKYTLRVLISNRLRGEEKPITNAAVSVKILGTTFRPLIYTLKTESDGVASLATEIPQFNSGRAAVLVRAVTKDLAAELRRIIHPAE